MKGYGVLDNRGDGCIMPYAQALFSHFHAEGWYWGAGYSTEDSHHFEVSGNVVNAWVTGGVPPVGAPSCSVNGWGGSCIATGECRAQARKSVAG